MSDQFLAEIRVFPFNFAPRGWAFCNGQLLPVRNNAGLFSVLRTRFGGDGVTTFGLPDLRGRVALPAGTSPVSGRTYTVGQAGGESAVALTADQIPSHVHRATAVAADVDARSPDGALLGSDIDGEPWVEGATSGDLRRLAPDAIGPEVGSGAPHDNMQPYLGFNFCIALQGIFPSRP